MKKLIIVVILASLLIIVIGECTKTPIEEATYEQLVRVDSIGPVLANAILSSNYTCVDDLMFDADINKGVKYIGKERLKELKKHFR